MASATMYCLRGILCWVLLLAVLSTVQGLRCYKCTHAGAASNPCVTDPWNITGVNDMECAGQCYSVRQVIKLNGDLFSVERWCDANTTRNDGDEDTGSMLIKTTTCLTDYCNDEDLTYTPPSTTPTTTGTTTTPNPASFKCYSCTYAETHSRECIDMKNPEKMETVLCPPQNYCRIVRTDHLETEVTQSFARGCQPKRDHEKNGCEIAGQFNVCDTFCSSELCNTGDGANPPPEPTAPPGGGVPALLGSTILLTLTSFCTLMFTLKY